MLGTSCCFHITDYSENVTNIITHMRMAVKEVRQYSVIVYSFEFKSRLIRIGPWKPL